MKRSSSDDSSSKVPKLELEDKYTTFPFNDLPWAVREIEFFQVLPQPERIRLRAVCKEFKAIVDQPMYIRRLQFEQYRFSSFQINYLIFLLGSNITDHQRSQINYILGCLFFDIEQFTYAWHCFNNYFNAGGIRYQWYSNNIAFLGTYIVRCPMHNFKLLFYRHIHQCFHLRLLLLRCNNSDDYALIREEIPDDFLELIRLTVNADPAIPFPEIGAMAISTDHTCQSDRRVKLLEYSIETDVIIDNNHSLDTHPFEIYHVQNNPFYDDFL